LALGSKSNSLAGATAQEIAMNQTSLLVKQHKKCPVFDTFQTLFGESPNCKPVDPQEVGSYEEDPEPDRDEGEGDVEADVPLAVDVPPVRRHVVVVAAAAFGVGVAAAAVQPAAPPPGGKPAATFHLAPSKKVVKLDLGEAYLKAQQLKIESTTGGAA
jgi:hypothetical protein